MYKKILLALALICWSDYTFAASDFGYPFAQIAKSSCKRQAWSELGPDCKMDLPKIANAEYSKYKNDTSYRRIYSVLWGATYDYGWDTGYGSHPGVDIATSEWTPVLSIGAGTVVSAGSLSGWGNSVTIKHTLVDKTVIYSNYSHLSKITVSKWDIVTKGQTIGGVGNTGNSYGNHLHFQIDITNQSHPYYFFVCAKGVNELKVVNMGMCRPELVSNTIDPIAFLETWNLSVVTPTSNTIEKIKDKPVIKIDPNSIESRQKVIDDEAAEYLKSFTIDIAIAPDGANIETGRTLTTNLSVRDPRGNAPKGNLPEAGLKITFDKRALTVFPESIIALDGGSRAFSITANKPGSYEIAFSLGKTVLGKRMVYVVPKGEKLEPTGMEIRVAKNLDLANETTLYIVPKSKYGSYLTNIAYNSRYRINVLKGKAKFCNVANSQSWKCTPLNVAEQLDFGYSESVRGYFSGKIIALDASPVVFTITKIGNKAPIAKSRELKVKSPTGLDRRNIYYDAIMAGLKRNWWKTQWGYALESREMTTADATEMMNRFLAYRVLKAGGDKFKKSGAANVLATFVTRSKKLPEQKWTRGMFANLLLESIGTTPMKNGTAKLMDEKWTYADVMITLRTKYNFAWLDQFGERYFQPDKTITVAEALYMVDAVNR